MTRVIQNRSGTPVPHPGDGPAARWSGPVIEATAEEMEPAVSLWRPVIAGGIAIFVGFGGFFGWAVSAELDSAAVATGAVIVDSRKKTVSHFEGGTLERLLVDEGDVVETGQPLLEIDDTRATGEVAQLRGERTGLLAQLARLRAEQRGETTIAFPEELTTAKGGIGADVMKDEQALFEQRLEAYRGMIAAQTKRIEQFEAEANALDAQIDASVRQKEIAGERLEKVRSLADKGYSTWREVSELEREWTAIAGDAGEYTAQRAKAEQGKAAAESDLLSTKAEWHGEIAASIQETQIKLNDVAQRLTTAQDVLKRRVVRSPQRGIVMNIQMRTTGSALAPGQPILDIVPENEKMIVEARISPRDIDAVKIGSPTQIRLTAYNQRTLAPLVGRLTYVAADQERDPNTGLGYYTVRAELAPEALRNHPDVSLYPGMPAELLVQHASRKAIDYLVEPITTSFNRAFRED